MFLCALVDPLFSPPPAPCLLYVSFLWVRLVCCCFFFFFCSVFALPADPARPACAPCSSPCFPCPAALRPLSRLSPLPFSFLLSTLPVRLPSCLSRAVTRVCHPRALPLPLPLARTLFPGVSPTLVLPRSPSPTPSWLPCALCGGGGGAVSADLTVALPEDWQGCWLPHHEPPHVLMEHRENVRETLVEFPLLHLHCGAQLHRPAADQRPHSDPARSPRGHTSLHLAGVPWRRRPPRPGVVNSSEQGARKSNVCNAAPSCHAESVDAM